MVSRSQGLPGRTCLFACVALLLSACGGGGGGGGGTAMQPQMISNSNLPTLAPNSGSVLLSWTPAMLNTDGTQFIDSAGYRILYGSSPDTMTQTVELKNAGLTQYMVENLPSGTSYFSIMSVNSIGVVGPASPVVAKTIN